jgi:nicotinate phosphoribosyltransferase
MAAGKASVLEFGLRRAQGDGGMVASRSAYLAGALGTSNVLAGQRYGIPVKGTHAHSFVMSYDSELEAFEAYAAASRQQPHPARRYLQHHRGDAECDQGLQEAEAGNSGERFGSTAETSRIFRRQARTDARRRLALDGEDRRLERSRRVQASPTLTAAKAPIDSYGVGTMLVTVLRPARSRLRVQAHRPSREQASGGTG